jgi:hypothetical protein
MYAPVDTQFYAPRTPVSIVALPNPNEAHSMRALLENMNCVVTVHWCGTPTDFLAVLGQGDSAPPYLIISGHGDEDEGFWLSSYAEFIDTSMLRGEYMPAEVIDPVVNLPGCTVISTACGTGARGMGRAFTRTGRVNAYIACRTFPHGSAMEVYLVNLFYNLLDKKLALRDAWHRAMVATDDPAIYQMSLFHAGGVEEQYQESGGKGAGSNREGAVGPPGIARYLVRGYDRGHPPAFPAKQHVQQ